MLDAAVQVAPGQMLAVVGANGSGKSTLLGAIAGTLPISNGTVRLGERVLCTRDDGTSAFSLRRANRRIGFLGQRARLFPHLDARANIAFGPRARGVHRRDAEATADEWLARVGLSGRGGARAGELSGGQQQRIAIARTLAADPQLLLLDEPFAALDIASSGELRELVATELRRLQIPAVMVTHDPVDLVTLADHTVVLETGKVAQFGTVAEVLELPATPFAAALTGRVLVRGTVSSGGLHVPESPIRQLSGVGDLPVPGATALASFSATSMKVTPDHDQPANENSWVGSISTVSAGPVGLRLECTEWPGIYAELPVSCALEQWITSGARVRWEIPRAAVRFACGS